jgi:hypothetical protein
MNTARLEVTGQFRNLGLRLTMALRRISGAGQRPKLRDRPLHFSSGADRRLLGISRQYRRGDRVFDLSGVSEYGNSQAIRQALHEQRACPCLARVQQQAPCISSDERVTDAIDRVQLHLRRAPGECP